MIFSQEMTDADWLAARARGCFATGNHSEIDLCSPVEGLVRHDGFCNALGMIAWTLPRPHLVGKTVGICENNDAFYLCNPSERVPDYSLGVAK